MKSSFFELSASDINGNDWAFSQLKGKVTLIVNVASRCGFTSQYTGLQSLYDRFKVKGLEIVAFPCNQFGAQEPGTAAEIKSFCDTSFGVTFPIMQKVDVNGPNTHPVFAYLKSNCPGLLGTESIKWNFTKFLVAPDGRAIQRFAPQVTPEELESAIIQHL
ncbi:MAG: glutathione peroxidase [Oligoflexia bacterium]|nr:glutathione peroxidase [Oligoflexia bacterium]